MVHYAERYHFPQQPPQLRDFLVAGVGRRGRLADVLFAHILAPNRVDVSSDRALDIGRSSNNRPALLVLRGRGFLCGTDISPALKAARRNRPVNGVDGPAAAKPPVLRSNAATFVFKPMPRSIFRPGGRGACV